MARPRSPVQQSPPGKGKGKGKGKAPAVPAGKGGGYGSNFPANLSPRAQLNAAKTAGIPGSHTHGMGQNFVGGNNFFVKYAREGVAEGFLDQSLIGEGFAEPKQIFVPSAKRRRINLVAICINLFLPWMIFCVVFSMTSFSFHYQHPNQVHLVTLASFLLAAILGSVAWRHRIENREPYWYTFSAMSIAIMTLMGKVMGEYNFYNYMQPFYDYEHLNTFTDVNPASSYGQQFMDGGSFYFADGAQLDMKKAMSFKDSDLYCVVPLSLGPKMDHYDFWAIGTNCCSSAGSDFRCGEFNNPKARSGLRYIRPDKRGYFRLAVQQAEEAYGIKAYHPIFFEWLQDPVDEMNQYRNNGFRLYLGGMCALFSCNFIAVSMATIGFAKVGYWGT